MLKLHNAVYLGLIKKCPIEVSSNCQFVLEILSCFQVVQSFQRFTDTSEGRHAFVALPNVSERNIQKFGITTMKLMTTLSKSKYFMKLTSILMLRNF